ncbi:ABC transporter permease [Streptomyces sp. NPDC012888]|uniref:ABC transporter permease n=1 Tax=Streptomyces sp. NPDC012888 TaxID=3364855 RepID=UPI0036860B2A
MSTTGFLPTAPVLRSEWIKIRSLRSTVGALLAILLTTAGIQTLTAAAIGTAEAGSMGDDPLLAAYYGLNFGQIAAIAFGATAVAGEFHNAGLRITLTAVPDRTRFYLAKIATIGGLAFLVGQVTALATFLGGQAQMGPYTIHLGDPGALRSVIGCGVYLTLLTLFAAGLTAVIRSAAAVLSLLVPFFLLVSFVIAAKTSGVAQFLPDRAGQVILRSEPEGVLGPWTGLGVMALWTVAALAGGWLAVRRRDA